jgi:hypothetical protein
VRVFPKPLTLFVAFMLGLLNGYGVLDLPTVPATAAAQSRWERLTDAYTHRVGCEVRQVFVLSTPGEPSEDRLRAVDRYCAGVPGTSLPNQPR